MSENQNEVIAETVRPPEETVQQRVEDVGAEQTPDEAASAPAGDVANPQDDVSSAPEESAVLQETEAVPPHEDKPEHAKVMPDSSVQQILEALKALQESFDGKLRYDAKKDAIIDRQFQELSQFKSGLVEKVTMQIVNDLIGEIDSAQKLVKFYEGAECNETNFKKLQKVLRDIPASLCDVLEKYGVTAYSSAVGAPFNPKRQRALKTTETGDETKDKTVRELLRLGFEQELEAKDDQPAKMKILRSEMVDVFVFNPALAEASDAVAQQEPQTESVVDASASKAE